MGFQQRKFNFNEVFLHLSSRENLVPLVSRFNFALLPMASFAPLNRNFDNEAGFLFVH